MPPPDATEITPEGSEYSIHVAGLRMRRMQDEGLVVLCGEGSVCYGKSVVEISPLAVSINGDALDIPAFTVRSRRVLDETEQRGYGHVENVTDIVVSSDGRWWEGVQHVSP